MVCGVFGSIMAMQYWPRAGGDCGGPNPGIFTGIKLKNIVLSDCVESVGGIDKVAATIQMLLCLILLASS